MVKATLRTGKVDSQVQTAAVAGAGTAAAPAAAVPRPATPANPAVKPRGTAPVPAGTVISKTTAVPVTPRAPARPQAPAPVPTPRAAARPAQKAAVPAATAVPATPAPARQLAARKPAETAAAPAPVIEVEAEVITEAVPTPVEGVEIETVTTIAAPVEEVASVEDQLLTETAPAPEAPPVDNAHVEEGCEQFASEAPHEAAPSAMIVRPPASVARAGAFSAAPGFEGDWGSDDLKFPQLKIVQGSGPLSAQFDTGTVIYADQTLLPPASVAAGAVNPVLYFVPISIAKQWRQNLTKEQQEAGEMPRVVNTIQEVEDLGGETRWLGGKKPDWSPSARCLFLVEAPEGTDHPGFVVDLDGRSYAVAVYYAGGSAFNQSAKIIYNTALTSLLTPVLDAQGNTQQDARGRILKAPMLYKNYWTMGFAKKAVGEYQVWQPVCRLQAKEETGPEVRQYIEGLLNNSTVEAAAETE